VPSFVESWSKNAALEVQEYIRLTLAAVRGAFSRPLYRHDIIEQLDAVGIGSLTVVLLTGIFTGMAITAQSGLTLDQFGARAVVGRLVGASMIKELGPVLTALMLTGRVGSGIAAELGSMMVTDQINALRALGTDPIRKLVVPRMLAGFIKEEFTRHLFAKVAALFALPVLKHFKARVDHRRYNGAALVGLRGIVVKSHGSADAYAFEHALRRAHDAANNGLLERIASTLARMTAAVDAPGDTLPVASTAGMAVRGSGA